jgi:hypothetical protein
MIAASLNVGIHLGCPATHTRIAKSVLATVVRTTEVIDAKPDVCTLRTGADAFADAVTASGATVAFEVVLLCTDSGKPVELLSIVIDGDVSSPIKFAPVSESKLITFAINITRPFASVSYRPKI